MSIKVKPLGGIDPLFPGCGKMYVTSNGYYLTDVQGGVPVLEWLEKNFEAMEDDIYVVSYPKTGTTWMQEITYVIANDLDFEKAKSKCLRSRFPYLELSLNIEKALVPNLPRPRFIKSHYPYSLLPQSIKDKKCKIIYTVRNPKDTIVSFYHFMKICPVICYEGDFETVFNLFINDERVMYSPFGKHVLEFWEQRHQDNLLIVHYENLKKDPCKEIRRVAQFLEKELTEDQIQQVKEHTSFKSMKANKNTNNLEFFGGTDDFLRKGEVGDWKNYFTEEMERKMDEYVEKHFKNSGFQFKYM